jgi:16S rRNA U516 pseudouridylate synthase RsuA-like enzyme
MKRARPEQNNAADPRTRQILHEQEDIPRAGRVLQGPADPRTRQAGPELELRVTVTEGKFHQVKKMVAAVGGHVVALHRER